MYGSKRLKWPKLFLSVIAVAGVLGCRLVAPNCVSKLLGFVDRGIKKEKRRDKWYFNQLLRVENKGQIKLAKTKTEFVVFSNGKKAKLCGAI